MFGHAYLACKKKNKTTQVWRPVHRTEQPQSDPATAMVTPQVTPAAERPLVDADGFRLPRRRVARSTLQAMSLTQQGNLTNPFSVLQPGPSLEDRQPP